MNKPNRKYSVNLSFEAIKLPPVTDILVLARKHPQGKVGVMESFRFMAPDEFEMLEIGEDTDNVEAVLVNRKIANRMPVDEIVKILRQHVFPYVSRGEAIKVNFGVKLTFDSIEGELDS